MAAVRNRYRIHIVKTKKGYTWVMYNARKDVVARAPKFWEGNLGKNHARRAAEGFQSNAAGAVIVDAEESNGSKK